LLDTRDGSPSVARVQFIASSTGTRSAHRLVASSKPALGTHLPLAPESLFRRRYRELIEPSTASSSAPYRY